ncbi:STAS domain-containing protein [Nonomuraea sp. NPDC050394]|uniref:STAS domain-containing protein n=1 Tax=Nonomuraea sp. NPDC050394 TaxID=3364363 RepID=UPI003791B20B
MSDVQRVDHGTCTVLRLVGAFGRETEPAMRLQEVMDLLPAPACVVLDVADMTDWDETTVGALIAAGKQAWSEAGWLVIAAAPPALAERFHEAALPFVLYDTTADAIAAFGSQR